jgi:hypothetical protein
MKAEAGAAIETVTGTVVFTDIVGFTAFTEEAGAYWVETLGCPKNQVDSDKLGRAPSSPTATSPWPTKNQVPTSSRPTSWWSTPAPSSRRPARSRSTPSSPSVRPARARRRAGGHRVHGRALRRRAGRGPARGRRRGRLRRARHPRPTRRGERHRRAVLRPAEPAPAPATAPWAYVKVAEGCDRACGFCAIPSFRGPAALAHDRRRSSTRSTQLGAQRSCSSPRTSPPSAATRASASGRSCRWSRRWPSGCPGAAALPVPVRPHRRLVDAICATGVPYFDLSSSTCRPAAAAHAPLGRRRAVPRSHRRPSATASPTPRSGPTSSSATRARPRTTTTQLLRFVEAGPARLVRVLRLLARGRHLRRRPRRRGPAGLVAERLGRAHRAAGRHHRPPP